MLENSLLKTYLVKFNPVYIVLQGSISFEIKRIFFKPDFCFFFNSGEDVEGKSFFDTFTATDVEPIAEATEAMETPSLTMPDQTQMIGQMSPLGNCL